MPNKSVLENKFEFQIIEAGLPRPQKQVKLIPGRRFAYDFFFAAPYNLAIEIQGGLWLKKGGHTSGAGVTRDAEKHTLATLAGYWTMAFTADHVHSGQAIAWTKEFIERVDNAISN
jgi:hypothetical protein